MKIPFFYLIFFFALFLSLPKTFAQFHTFPCLLKTTMEIGSSLKETLRQTSIGNILCITRMSWMLSMDSSCGLICPGNLCKKSVLKKISTCLWKKKKKIWPHWKMSVAQVTWGNNRVTISAAHAVRPHTDQHHKPQIGCYPVSYLPPPSEKLPPPLTCLEKV